MAEASTAFHARDGSGLQQLPAFHAAGLARARFAKDAAFSQRLGQGYADGEPANRFHGQTLIGPGQWRGTIGRDESKNLTPRPGIPVHIIPNELSRCPPVRFIALLWPAWNKPVPALA